MKKHISMFRNHGGLFAACIIPALAFVSTAHAGTSYSNPITIMGVTDIPSLLLAIVDLVFLIAMPIIVLFVIYAGYLFLTAGDNESKVSKAKFTLMWCLIGVAILLGAKVIAKAIETTILTL
jgi:hypothetical protein